MRRALLSLGMLTLACVLGACGRQERIISITSEPEGAIVWLNDYELGRTPVQADFTFFGTYDVRLSKEGYEPLVTSREAIAPFYEYPGIDLIATAIPGTRRTRLDWHFDLTPLPSSTTTDRQTAESELAQRAAAFRGEAEAKTSGEAPPPSPPSTPE